MDWLVLAAIGAIIGSIVSLVGTSPKLPKFAVTVIATVGALAGGLLTQVTHFASLGPWTFYIAGIGLSIATVAGALLAYSLTNEHKTIS